MSTRAALPPTLDVPDGRPSIEQVWRWLDAVADPEIPVISVVDLGIVRTVAWVANEEGDGGLAHPDVTCVVTITPTYSGCPAMAVIAESISLALQARGIARVTIATQLAPAWTTDWMSANGKQKLTGYGIAPPAEQVIDISGISRKTSGLPKPRLVVACPLCGSTHTALTSQFGSTPCKALYRCEDCREPFDYFKCH
ncbi:MAG: phenylacetate-CoA oxygenase subunit PaaJ [Herminiimonas sp.]|nr:phenylacetate-CoA oxygenase subunit PaaJ [Herminiimonas sp.]